MLNGLFKPKEITDAGQRGISSCTKTPKVPICSAERVVAKALSSKRNEIDDANNAILKNINAFLEDIQNQIAGVSGALSDITSLIGGISGSITAALSFENLKLNIFGCELAPNCAVSDYYTFAKGGAGAPDTETPSASATDSASKETTSVTPEPTVPFLEPTKATPNQTLSDSSSLEQIQQRVGNIG
jgi:hypothetical protein